MAKCKYCGAEVTIGERCTYCGSKAESWYYPVAEKAQEPKKKKAPHNRVRDLFNGKIYIVKEGDCLWNIAKNLYGSGAEYYRLVELNNIQDPNHIEEHSKKPAETRDRIVKLMAGGGLPKIELFARQSIDGWDCWGNEV